MSALSERAVLVTLNVSQWTARKFDRNETLAVNRKHSLSIEAARVNKALLPKGTELQTLQRVTDMIRKDYEKHTLPWGIDGMRILKSEAYLSFSQEVQHWRDAWEIARDQFLAAYPRLKRDAAQSLGGLYDESDYLSQRDPWSGCSGSTCGSCQSRMPGIGELRSGTTPARRWSRTSAPG